jgi:hypothetical protein
VHRSADVCDCQLYVNIFYLHPTGKMLPKLLREVSAHEVLSSHDPVEHTETGIQSKALVSTDNPLTVCMVQRGFSHMRHCLLLVSHTTLILL